MTTLTEEQIKEIAQELDCGNKCFVHKETNELIFIPDTNRNPTMDTEFFDEEMEKIDNNFDDYNVIETLESKESFEIMADFTEQLEDNNKLKTKLTNALSNKKPFREFKFVIDESGAYRQKWFDFRESKLEEFVRNRLYEINDLESSLAKPKKFGKNRWLHPTDEFGKMEEGKADYESSNSYETKKRNREQN
jgi:hypothetical protein